MRSSLFLDVTHRLVIFTDVWLQTIGTIFKDKEVCENLTETSVTNNQ
jgi:hypothetical protein